MSPVLLSGISNLTKNSSDVITFTCIFSGFPRPDITWYDNGGTENIQTGEVLVSTGRLNITTSIRAMPLENDGQYTVVSQLSIYDLQAADEGYYECSAVEFILGTENSSTGYLEIQGMINLANEDIALIHIDYFNLIFI